MALNASGRPVFATIKHIDAKSMRSMTYENNKLSFSRGTIYMLFAEWQHPETRNVYTFKSMVRDQAKFPVGCSVSFLVDMDHPRWYRLESQ
jgi:hypothetical protein